MTAGAGRSVAYTSFNMAATITQGASTTSLAYDSDHARFAPTDPDGANTFYVNDAVSGAMAEAFYASGASVPEWRDYILADGHIIAERIKPASGSAALHYFVADHLGSIAAVTDDSGAVVTGSSAELFGCRTS